MVNSIYAHQCRNPGAPDLVSPRLLRGRGNGPSEEQNVRLRLVEHVVDPALALLNSQLPPLLLGHEVGLGDEFGEVLGQHDVPVLELVIEVLVGVVDLLAGHPRNKTKDNSNLSH